MNEVKLNGNSFCLSEEVIRIYWPILAGPSLQFRLFLFVLVQEFEAGQPTYIDGYLIKMGFMKTKYGAESASLLWWGKV